MPENLAQKTCTPCKGGIPPLTAAQVEELLPLATDWEAIEAHTKIQAQFKFKNFRASLDFVGRVGELAEAEFHHPLFINFGWGFTTIVLQTKKIKGLHENDFIMAAKITDIARSVATGTAD
jgi:4a-hydroxytetrahydrobiopterin dehydratase